MFETQGQPSAGIQKHAIMGSIVISRLGLWSLDLAHTQVMQEWVEENKRGVVNGMQTATYQVFMVIIQALGMIFSQPSQFIVMVTLSMGAVGAAATCYTLWYFRLGQYGSHTVISKRKQ